MKPDIINKAFTRSFLTPIFQTFWYSFFPIFILVFLKLILFSWNAFRGQANPFQNLQYSIILLFLWGLSWTIFQQIATFISTGFKILEKIFGRLFDHFAIATITLILFIHPFLFLLNHLFLEKNNPHFWVQVVWNSLFTLIGSIIFILWIRRFPRDSWRVQLFSALLVDLLIQFFLLKNYLPKVSPSILISESFILYIFYWLGILVIYFLFVQTIYRPKEKTSYFDLYEPFLKKKTIILTSFIVYGISLYIYHLANSYNFLHYIKVSSLAIQFLAIYLAIQSIWFQFSNHNTTLRKKFISLSENPEKFLFYLFFFIIIMVIFTFIQFAQS